MTIIKPWTVVPFPSNVHVYMSTIKAGSKEFELTLVAFYNQDGNDYRLQIAGPDDYTGSEALGNTHKLDFSAIKDEPVVLDYVKDFINKTDYLLADDDSNYLDNLPKL